MIRNYFVNPFLFLPCLIGNTVGEGVMSKNYRFKIFSEVFLDSTSVKSDTSDLLGKFKTRPKYLSFHVSGCSIRCTRDSKCGAFYFDKESSSCQCFNKVFSSVGDEAT